MCAKMSAKIVEYTSLQRVSSYDTKPSPVLDIWGMWSTLSLPLLPDPLWSGVVVSIKVSYIVQLEQFDHL